MKIVALVKYVPDATGDREFDDDGTVDREGSDGILSELDEYAIEQSCRSPMRAMMWRSWR